MRENMSIFKGAERKKGFNLLIPKCKLETFLFASMSAACQLYDCCEQVAECSVLLAALGDSLEEELSLEDSHYIRFWPCFQD